MANGGFCDVVIDVVSVGSKNLSVVKFNARLRSESNVDHSTNLLFELFVKTNTIGRVF